MALEKDKRIFMAYVAGMIDGDGSICFNTTKGRSYPAVHVTLSSESLIKHFLNNLGGTLSITRKLFRWTVRKRKEAVDILHSISGFLVEKQAIALAVIAGNKEESERLNKYTCQEKITFSGDFRSDDEVYSYIAGYIDSDGHITLKKRNRDSSKKRRCYPDYSLEIGCGGTDFRSTHFISDFLKIGNVKVRPHKFCVNGKRIDFRVTSNKEAKRLLEKLIPCLFLKKKNAETALEYIEGYQTVQGPIERSIVEEQIWHREACYQKMKLFQIRK